MTRKKEREKNSTRRREKSFCPSSTFLTIFISERSGHARIPVKKAFCSPRVFYEYRKIPSSRRCPISILTTDAPSNVVTKQERGKNTSSRRALEKRRIIIKSYTQRSSKVFFSNFLIKLRPSSFLLRTYPFS